MRSTRSVFAGELVDAVAGWAIDHQVGLALRGLGICPAGAVRVTKNHPRVPGGARRR